MDSTINIDEIKYKIEDYILFCLSNEESLHFLKVKELGLFDAIELFLMRKAKRIRPILLMLTYHGYASSETNEESIIHAAVAVELMHTFALIHDDIIDRSPMRDSIPSLYQAIDNLSHSGKHSSGGDRMAMLIGDLIYNIALNEFQKVSIKNTAKLAGMELLLSTALQTGRGQLMELIQKSRNIAGITPKEIFNIYDLKTASYTFCLPLKMGALLAGQKKQELHKLDDIGLKLGRAYQIIDDINDFCPESAETYNMLTALLWKKSDSAEKKTLRKLLTGGELKEGHLECLQDLYSKHDIIMTATSTAYGFIDEAVTGIEKLALGDELKNELIEYVSSIMKIKKR